MSKILVPSDGPNSWKQFLAQPERQWASGYSARTIAHAWESAAGFPPEVAVILADALGETELLLASPEHKTPLPGGRRDSQSDVFALGRHASGLVACTIEGKVNESFGPTVGEWLRDASAGKLLRLKYLCGLLGIEQCPPGVHYQLLHRAAAALIEADRFAAADAAMIVHSFSPERRWSDAYEQFVALLSQPEQRGQAMIVAVPSGRSLVLGWACGDPAFLLC